MQTTDVLVVGAGPVGLVSSALLARDGADAITVGQNPGPRSSPRAVFINQRTVEIFRELGLEEDLHRVATPIRALGNNVWATSFAGTELARMHAWGTGPDRRGEYAATSPCEIVNAPQHVLEPVLLNGARKAGADIRFDTEVTAISQDDTHVHATVQDHATGQQHTIRARYLIGADGGRSLVAQQAGITYEDDTGVLNRAVNVWLEADLTEHCAHRPALIYLIHEPGEDFHSTSWITIRPWNEWIMSIIYPGDQGHPELDTATAAAYARRMIADPAVEVRIKSISHWSVDRALASQFRRGWIFLAGDSAHRHPPPNGLGSNTGMQDAYNLCWKLAMVLRGQAGDRLLDSYDTERKPVARTVIDQTTKSLRLMDPMVDALGLQPGQTPQQAWSRIHQLSADDETGRQRRRDSHDAIELQHYHYNCHGTEAGHRYPDGALVPADPQAPDRDPELHYEPSTAPGAHLPHAWLEHTKTPMSTLDVVGNGQLTLLTGIGGQPWVAAACDLAWRFGIVLQTAVIGPHQQYHDVYGTWTELREIGDAGALLVRPDCRVAWRRHELVNDPIGDLSAGVHAALVPDGPSTATQQEDTARR